MLISGLGRMPRENSPRENYIWRQERSQFMYNNIVISLRKCQAEGDQGPNSGTPQEILRKIQGVQGFENTVS